MRTYNVLIIEDEIPAQANLRRAIERQFDDLRVVGVESIYFVIAPKQSAFLSINLFAMLCGTLKIQCS